MEKEAITSLLEEKHQQLFNWLENQPEDTFKEGPEGKWTTGQHIVHLVDSIKQVNKMKELGSSIQKTDPTRKFAPVTLVSASMPDKSLIKKRAQRKRLNFKESFPYLLKKLFGEEFFFVKLKIPKEKYFHFLSYCNPLGIEQLYKEGRRLELLKVLLKESKSYLLLLEKSK